MASPGFVVDADINIVGAGIGVEGEAAGRGGSVVLSVGGVVAGGVIIGCAVRVLGGSIPSK